MLFYFHKTLKDQKLKQLPEFKVGCWVHLESPTKEELSMISKKLDLDIGHLNDSLDPNEVPRFEAEGKTYYIFSRVPTNENRETSSSTVVLFVYHDQFLLSVSPQKNTLFQPFMNNELDFFTTQKIKLLIQFFKHIDMKYNLLLNLLNRNIQVASVRTEKITNRNIIELVTHEYQLNNLLNASIRNNSILNTLLNGKYFDLFKDDRELIEDLFLNSGQLIELAKSSLTNVKNIRDAYSTIMTNNLNRVIKFFTSLTIVLTIPTIIASFFGMNVVIPGSNHPLSFMLIILFTFGFCAGILYFFQKKDWL